MPEDRDDFGRAGIIAGIIIALFLWMLFGPH